MQRREERFNIRQKQEILLREQGNGSMTTVYHRPPHRLRWGDAERRTDLEVAAPRASRERLRERRMCYSVTFEGSGSSVTTTPLLRAVDGAAALQQLSSASGTMRPASLLSL